MEDSDGYLWFRSRKDDVITSMGYRIGPGEIEECLMGHPAVAIVRGGGGSRRQSGVTSPQPLWFSGRARNRRRLWQRNFRTMCAPGWPPTRPPRQMTFLDELPRTTTGKILRRALRPS